MVDEGGSRSGPAVAGAGGAVTRLLLLADTHLPVRARALPERVWEAVDAADVVVHAGDWVHEDLLDQMLERTRSAGGRLLGVAGNNDGPQLHRRLGEVVRADVGGLALAVVHETGPAQGRERRCAQRFGDADVLVFGHSHVPWDSAAQRPGGATLRLLNPGSPTDRRRQPACTFMTAAVVGAQLVDVVLHRLPQRAPAPRRGGPGGRGGRPAG